MQQRTDLWQQSHGVSLDVAEHQYLQENHSWQPVIWELQSSQLTTTDRTFYFSSHLGSLDIPNLPSRNRQEAELITTHFVQHISLFFDLCDLYHRFKLVTPERATLSLVLLNAILVASAKHLSRIVSLDPMVAVKYHQKTIQYLIPAFHNISLPVNENLFAATVILRYLEELQGMLMKSR